MLVKKISIVKISAKKQTLQDDQKMELDEGYQPKKKKNNNNK